MDISIEKAKELATGFIYDALREGEKAAKFAMCLRKCFARTEKLIDLAVDANDGRLCLKIDPEEVRKFLLDKDLEKAYSLFIKELKNAIEDTIGGKFINPTKRGRFAGRSCETPDAVAETIETLAKNVGETPPQRKKAINKSPWNKRLCSFIDNSGIISKVLHAPKTRKFRKDPKPMDEEPGVRRNVAIAIDVTGTVTDKDVEKFFHKMLYQIHHGHKVTIMECGKDLKRSYRFPPTKRETNEIPDVPTIKFLEKSEEFNPKAIYAAVEGLYDAAIIIGKPPMEKREPFYHTPIKFLDVEELRNA